MSVFPRLQRLAVYVWCRLARRSAIKRLFQFGLVGLSGVCVNLGIFSVLTTVMHLHYLVAGPIGIEVALCSNYLLNNIWTFADRSSRVTSWGGLSRYHAVTLGGTLINLGVLQVLAAGAGVAPLVANLVGIVVATTWNFGLSLGWTWRRTHPVDALGGPMLAARPQAGT